MRAVQLSTTGGPEVLRPVDLDVPEPGPGEVRVRVEAAGVNFIDTYHRSGAYDLDLPTVPGVEGAGTVEVVGDGVDGVAVGDRVAWVMQPGAYAERAVVAAERVVPVPAAVDAELAAAVLLQGMTAHYLSHDTYPLGPDDTTLVLAAAGGVGHLLVQLARDRGARVIGTTSTDEKEALVRRDGAHEVVRYREVDLAAAVRGLTGGRGVDVVYDSVGAATFQASLDCLRPRGMLVLYGQSSGPVAPLDPQVLNRKGSLFLTRPSLSHYVADRSELEQRAGDLFGAVAAEGLEVRIDRRLPLDEAAEAHRYVEAGRTRGKVLLMP